MSSLWVVLDTRSDETARRVGRVKDPDDIAAEALEVSVVWPDGNEERVRFSRNYVKLRLDWLKALAMFSPQQLAEEFESTPLIFARALAERHKGFIRSSELLATVCERTGFDKAIVEKAWRSQKKSFESLAEVQVEQSSSGAKYKLRHPLSPVVIPGVDATPGEMSLDQERTPSSAAEAALESAELANESTAGPAGPFVGTVAPVVSPEISTNQASALEIAEPNFTDVLSGRQLPPIDSGLLDGWLATDAPAAAISDGATALERLRSQPEAHAERLAGFSRLVSRLAKYPGVSIPAETWARAFVALRRSDVDAERRRGLDALERTLSVMNKPTEFLSRIDKPAFQHCLSELTLADGHPRSRFLLLLARANRSALDEVGWWRGFSWSDVLTISSGPLSAVMSSSEFLSSMIRRVVDEFARDVTTRSSLSALLGAPRFALEHISPERMVSIFETVAKNDTLFAGWRAALAGQAEKAALVKATSTAQEEALVASAARDAAFAERDELSEQLARVQEQVTSLQNHTAGLTARERRQLLIDAATVVAQIAATVEGDGRALDHDSLSRKVSGLAEKFGLTAHARSGDSVAFDPSLHRAPGPRPTDGETVNVARAGYTWEEGGEKVVVLPALVTRMSGNEESS